MIDFVMKDVLEIKSLTKVYKNGANEVTAISEMSLSLAHKDFVSIVGPSGSGKSTLLHMIGGLDLPTFGEILYKGKNIYCSTESQRAIWRKNCVGFVFQFYHLIEELNVIENIILGCGSRKEKPSLKNAQNLLEYLGVAARRDFFPSQLSGGERQKIAIARALINDPELLLCDEPTGNLDPDSQEKVIELLKKLNKEKDKTVIVVTHNMELARRADKTITMRSGRLIT